MEALKERIRKEGKVLPGNIIKVDVVLTAEASGIALAAICAYRYNKPLVFAKKAKSDNIEGGLYCSEIVSKEWLHAGDRVLIIDDFLARGEAMRGLCEIVEEAGCELVGIGCAVEKGFQHGGDKLREAGVNLKSLAILEKAEPGCVEFRED